MGVRLAKTNSKQEGHEVIRAGSAVISNASVWDTQRLLPGGVAPQKWRQESLATPMTGSFMHLHLGEALQMIAFTLLLQCVKINYDILQDVTRSSRAS